jgi:hypothetical protein
VLPFPVMSYLCAKPSFLFASACLSVCLPPDIKASRSSARPSGIQSHQQMSCEGIFSSTLTLVCVSFSLSFPLYLVLCCIVVCCLVMCCLVFFLVLDCLVLSGLCLVFSCLVLFYLVLLCLTFSPFLDVPHPNPPMS